MKSKEVEKKRFIGTFEIINIVLAMFAFAFIVGLSAEEVSGEHIYDPVSGYSRRFGRSEHPSTTPIETIVREDLAESEEDDKQNPNDNSDSEKDGEEEGYRFFMWEIQNAFFGHIYQGFKWSLGVVTAIQLIGGIAGIGSETRNTASIAAISGIMAGQATLGAIKQEYLGLNKLFAAEDGKFMGLTQNQFSFGIGLAVAAAVFALTYKDEKKEIVTFDCLPWEAPVGGQHCEKCNDAELPCSEYRCRSLGQACELLNPGTDEELCTWVNKRDTDPPLIEPWEEVLTNEYKYTQVSRDGLRIVREGSNCIKAFTPITFGISTNEPAQCKIDYNHTKEYDDMQFYFGGDNLYKYNHSQSLNLPSPESINAENPEIQNNGRYTLYIRCRDRNGRVNEGNEYSIRFCVDKGPDLTPPEIVATSVQNNMPVAFNQNELDLEVYTNEPATCKWSRVNQNYENMATDMQCNNRVYEMNANLLYKCETTLTGIKNNQENKYYFRCKDQPRADEGDRNKMLESLEFTIIGTQELDIIEVKPESGENIKGSTDVVEIGLELHTFGGYNEGQAVCYYSLTGEDGDYVMFFETDSHTHMQRQDLPEGDYDYYFKCIDLGGNEAKNQTSFTIEVDTEPPSVIRVYKEGGNLKIVTNEDAKCVYGTDSCTYVFNDGIEMEQIASGRKREHYANWNQQQTYYIKCKDESNREPSPTQCSIIARPSMIK